MPKQPITGVPGSRSTLLAQPTVCRTHYTVCRTHCWDDSPVGSPTKGNHCLGSVARSCPEGTTVMMASLLTAITLALGQADGMPRAPAALAPSPATLQPTAPSEAEAPRRALPPPFPSPPFPSPEYQGFPLIGIPMDTTRYPLMK